MTICTMPIAPTKKNDFEYFQRKKVGSIRDNPKLMKIRQRFESACQNANDGQNITFSDSAPSSMSLSKRTGSGVLEDLLKNNSSFSDKTESFVKSQLSARRHSEGEANNSGRSSLSVFVSKQDKLKKNATTAKRSGEQITSTTNLSSIFKGDKIESSSSKTPETGKTVSRSHILERVEHSELDNSISNLRHAGSNKFWVQQNKKDCKPNSSLTHAIEQSRETKREVQAVENADASAPPIPRRGISAHVKKNAITPLSLKSSQNYSTCSSESSSRSKVKTSPVKKTIQMYEGMSSSQTTKKNTLPKTANQKLLKKESSERYQKLSGFYRRSPRKNSMRKSKSSTDSILNTTISTAHDKITTEDSCSKEDSGMGSSDAEDKVHTEYQKLSTVVRDLDDHYDRLKRIHDEMTRIHKGQISTCAACKTFPPATEQWPAEDHSILRVKCHEAAPHHHPPCICFSCSHSVFSCSLDVKENDDDDSLYSNVCCLNLPGREGWRQSRRRPVCETNGRLCVVNCDMEQGQVDSCYDRLWSSSSKGHSRDNLLSKVASADSCDSDEGWVDVTDSEDEKNYDRVSAADLDKTDESLNKNLLDSNSSLQNSAYDIDTLFSKFVQLDICDNDHLYETIPDVNSETENNDNEMLTANESNDSSIKHDISVPENDMDSGEWSTESTSPIFGESTNKNELQPKLSESSAPSRFSIHLENQDTAKVNFMKSVLGKKGPSTKRRMSNFFVPWLVMNEYTSTPPKNHKTVTKKKSSCYPMTSSKTSPRKTKRSQSTPGNSPDSNRSSNSIHSSLDSLDASKTKENRSEGSSHKFLDNLCFPSDLSSRTSIASSAYIQTDELLSPGLVKENPVVINSDAPPIEVSIERICRKSSSGTSEHSYILFQPINEEEVPLYQFYERNVKERVSFCCSPNSLVPVFGTSMDIISNNDSGMRPQISVIEQLSPDAKDMKMLWCELPEVKESGILERISAQELKLQEAAFEFIQSQASFIRSLKVLYENFIRIPEFSDQSSSSCVLSKHEHDVLFSDIIRVKEVGENLLGDLTARWSEGILIPDICDIIHQHATLPSFSAYVKYCSNRVYQERTLKELKETRLCFLEVLRKLESNPVCQGLSLESFLFLPMQHIARLPLLLDNMFRWLTPESPSYCTCKLALEAVHKIFMECNDGARKMERLEEMFVLNKQLEFKECKALPLISASRWLLKKGELLKLEFDKKTFGRSSRCVRVPVFIFLFNDLLVVTKRKSEDCYLVVDYCSRDKVQAMVASARDLQHPMVVPNTCRYLIYLTLFHNHQGNTVDMVLSCTLLSERTRWIEAIHSVPENKPCEVWEYDCPQVQCVRNYIAQQPDELSLQESDVVSIHRKMNDGWYEGRRLRDGMQGWFPASYTMDIPCSRARASNLRQCYRLLMLSQKQ